jgi:hypothetical protein
MIMEDEKLVDQQSDDQLLKDCVQWSQLLEGQ